MSAPLTAQQIRVLVELADMPGRGHRYLDALWVGMGARDADWLPLVDAIQALHAGGYVDRLISARSLRYAYALTPAGRRAAVLAQSDELVR